MSGAAAVEREAKTLENLSPNARGVLDAGIRAARLEVSKEELLKIASELWENIRSDWESAYHACMTHRMAFHENIKGTVEEELKQGTQVRTEQCAEAIKRITC